MANERYHGPLITTGVSLAYIKLFPWITLFISSVSLWGTTFIDNWESLKSFSYVVFQLVLLVLYGLLASVCFFVFRVLLMC